MGRHANPDIRRAFAEFQDADTPTKCNKVRCLHCGFVRAKNTTRQIEHLQECQAYQASSDAQVHLTEALGDAQPDSSTPSAPPTQMESILSGRTPNPNLQIHRRGPNTNKRARELHPIAPSIPIHHHPINRAPSLTAHLLTSYQSQFVQGTQHPFLSHAGCGSLAAAPLAQWLVQDGHFSRGYIRFVGQLVAKIRLPQTQNSQFHPMYRAMDLLISALNNRRREMQFFEITTTKYGLVLGTEGPTPITRSLLDLLLSASSSSASLLEGMVVLWAMDQCYRSAWQYASTFNTALPTSSAEAHIAALHQTLIPNWTSPAFNKFVDASRALVDELANITTTRDGKEESTRCEEVFKQVCWLSQRFWPDVNGMGEEAESSRHGGPMDNATYAGSLNQNISSASNADSFNNAGMGGQMNAPMNTNMPNNQVNGQMDNQMNAPPNASISNSQINSNNMPSSNQARSGPRTFNLDPDGDIDTVEEASQSSD